MLDRIGPRVLAALVCSLVAACTPNLAPTGSNGLLVLAAQSPFSGFLAASDPEGDPLTFSIVSGPLQGTLTLTDPSSGAFSFVPAPGQTASVQFSYVASDGKTSSAPIQVQIENGLSLAGDISGLSGGAEGQIVASSPFGMAVAEVDGRGHFTFHDLPSGRYAVKAAFGGFAAGPAEQVDTLEPGLYWNADVQPDPSIAIDFEAHEVGSGPFLFHWEEDASLGGLEYSSHNTPLVIEAVDEAVELPDAAAAQTLDHDYHVVLSNEQRPWTQEHAYRLLETLREIPQQVRSPYAAQTLPASQWVLVDELLANDIEIVSTPAGRLVRLSAAAFSHATPRTVRIDGVRGRFFSKRLHHAAVRFVTDEGRDLAAVEKILGERFGVSMLVADYAALTGEGAGHFQPFHAEERVTIINLFEEMPAGMHRVDGLHHLVRRLDGTGDEVPAIAWTSLGYIEFRELAFIGTTVEHLHRLILHEKAHFLWAHVFSTELRQAWIQLGGWSPSTQDINGWTTSRTTEFVTAYAHLKNPDEDMAESISYYVIDPDALRSRARAKFEFLRDHVMNGDLFVAEIREDLTFEVYNLDPDYVFPGKIRRVDIRVDGGPQADKTATVELELHDRDGSGGADHAQTRLFSSVGTYIDVHLSPVNPSKTVLRATFTLSRFAKAGLWQPDQIVLTDAVGNQRLNGVNDFGWKLFVDNALEDLEEPSYVPNSLTLGLATDALHYERPVQIATARWAVSEDAGIRWCYASLVNQSASAYSLGAYGSHDPNTGLCTVQFVLTEYRPSGVYALTGVSMEDLAHNQRGATFSSAPGDEPAPSVLVATAQPDLSAPELDLDDISISAAPTHPEAPNGETRVTIVYHVRDDRSGLGTVAYRLRDPQGTTHHAYHYHENFYTLFFAGDPTAWKRYEINVTLPAGSAPGTWGLSEMYTQDKAGNAATYSFVEIVHFEVD